MSMGITQMNSLLSSANTLKSVSNLNTSRTQMNGQSRILSAEIKADKGRGVDTKAKEEDLAETEERLQGIEENIGNSLTELNERLEADREKIREEEAEQARQAEKAVESKTEKTTAAPSGEVTNASVSGIAKTSDMLEISPEAKAAAEANVTTHIAPIASNPAQTPSTGKALDIKV